MKDEVVQLATSDNFFIANMEVSRVAECCEHILDISAGGVLRN